MPVAGHAATSQLAGSVPFYEGDKTHLWHRIEKKLHVLPRYDVDDQPEIDVMARGR